MAEEKKIDIELRPEIARGIYSNLAIISHSPSEFTLDFVQMLPGMAKPSVGGRVIMTPEHTKRLLKALMDNVQRYESQFGEIRLRDNTTPFTPPMGFKGEA
ncbi:MAG: DUF3467 domain-containing protein [Bacteroidales bacterium]|nr:DUF3467 domain-containing protein [Bacteroidales bacterium]